MTALTQQVEQVQINTDLSNKCLYKKTVSSKKPDTANPMASIKLKVQGFKVRIRARVMPRGNESMTSHPPLLTFNAPHRYVTLP